MRGKLYHHAMNFKSREVHKKKLNMNQNAVNSTTAGIAARLMQKAVEGLTNSFSFRSLQADIEPSMSLSPAMIQSQALSQVSGSFVSLKPK